MIELKDIRRCFESDRVLYSAHARREMRNEEFGPIVDQEVYELVCSGEIIKQYPDDMPYPSCLIYGTTNARRPLHTVCAYAQENDQVVIITVYHPDIALWEDYTRRKK